MPITQSGTQSATTLIDAGVRVTLTAVYEVPQILIAEAIGAEYAAPYLGRINDAGGNGSKTLATMQQVFNGVQIATRTLTASIRDVSDISYLAAHGLDTFTFSPRIAEALFSNEQTMAATAAFERAVVATENSTVG